MTRPQPLDRWTDQVRMAFPNLSRPQATVLALYSFGMILAQRCGLNSVVTALVPVLGVGFHTLRSRLQEFYQPAAAKSGRQRDQLDVTTCFAPLLAWILQGWKSTRLALALDATSLGDRFTVLSIGVVYRGQAIPVAWKVLHANVPHPWKPEWIALLRALRRLGPARLDGDRDDRPRPVCPLALPGDRGLGLAPRDADHPAEQVPQGRLEAEPSRSRRWCRGRAADGRAAGWLSPRSPSGGWNAR